MSKVQCDLFFNSDRIRAIKGLRTAIAGQRENVNLVAPRFGLKEAKDMVDDGQSDPPKGITVLLTFEQFGRLVIETYTNDAIWFTNAQSIEHVLTDLSIYA